MGSEKKTIAKEMELLPKSPSPVDRATKTASIPELPRRGLLGNLASGVAHPRKLKAKGNFIERKPSRSLGFRHYRFSET
jgi:hypothetical protein